MKPLQRSKCGFLGCFGCSACDPDGSPGATEESDLQRMQRHKREEDALRAAGQPTMRVKLGDALKRRR